MKMKFKVMSHFSNAKMRRIRKRSVKIALCIPYLRLLVTAKTEEEFQTLVKHYDADNKELREIIESYNWEKLPRKLKKKEKQRVSDIYNAFIILPELAAFIISNRDEKDSDQA